MQSTVDFLIATASLEATKQGDMPSPPSLSSSQKPIPNLRFTRRCKSTSTSKQLQITRQLLLEVQWSPFEQINSPTLPNCQMPGRSLRMPSSKIGNCNNCAKQT